MISTATLETDRTVLKSARVAGAMLIFASLAVPLVMTQHPVQTAQSIADIAAELARQSPVLQLVHGSLIALQSILLLAFVELSWHLGLQRRF